MPFHARIPVQPRVKSTARFAGASLRARKLLETWGERLRAITESGTAVLLNQDGTWVPEEGEKPSAKDGFRKSAWGSTVAQVKAAESIEPRHETDDYIDFEVKLGRFKCLAVYIFVGDKLVRGKYSLLEEYRNQNNFLTAYDELKESVTKKYGPATDDKTYWLNDLYKDDYSEWGMAVGCGHLSKFATWDTLESTITVGILGENFDVSVGVEYSSKAFSGLEDAVAEADLMDDL
jgi:hypothetical protein